MMISTASLRTTVQRMFFLVMLQMYQCDKCTREYESKSQLMRHLRERHGPKIK